MFELYRRKGPIFENSFDPEYAEFLHHAYWDRNNALDHGFFHNRFEMHLFSYVKSLEIARHRYFLSVRQQQNVSIDEAVDSFSDEGYEIGFHAHWISNFRKNCINYHSILFATSLEGVHNVLGDYLPLPEYAPQNQQAPMKLKVAAGF